MIATFLNVNDDKFSLNGVESFKIFIPIIAGDRVMVVNAFDSRRILLNYTNFADFRVDGQSFANPAALVNALNSLIFAWKASGGNSNGNYTGVSLDPYNALNNGNDGMPYLSETLLNGGEATVSHGIISFNSGYISGLNFKMSLKWDFNGQRFEVINQAETLDPADPDLDRIDVVYGNNAGVLGILKGTPAANPEAPAVDPETQLEATFFIIKAGALAPEGVSGTPIYNEAGTYEGGEWLTTESTTGARITINSTAASQTGNFAVEMTGLLVGDTVTFKPENSVNVTNFKEVAFYIKNKAAVNNSNPLSVRIFGYRPAGTRGANQRVIYQQAISDSGYDRLNTTDWQLISFPADVWDLETVNSLSIRCDEAGTGFFIDNVRYISGTETSTPENYATVEYVDAKNDLKANDLEVVKRISLNGGTAQEPVDGLVDLTVSTDAATPIQDARDYAGTNIFTFDNTKPIDDPNKVFEVYLNGQRLDPLDWSVTSATEITITATLETEQRVVFVGASSIAALKLTDTISFALSAPSVDLVAGDTDSFHAPYDFTLNSYFIGVAVAPDGSDLIVDVKKNGTSITSTKAAINSLEYTSLTGVAPVLTEQTFVKGDLITPNISQVGALETGKSLKIYLEITKS